MNILGYEIDPSFVHTIHPITICETNNGYEYCFVLDFKDGRSHKVKVSNNYSDFEYKEKLWSDTPFLSNAYRKKMLIKKPKDGERIKKIRMEIIQKMTK